MSCVQDKQKQDAAAATTLPKASKVSAGELRLQKGKGLCNFQSGKLLLRPLPVPALWSDARLLKF